MEMNQQQTDHDLLIALNTKFDIMSRDFKEMSNDGKERITRLEESKLDKESFINFLTDYKDGKTKQDSAITFLNKWFWIAYGAFAISQMIFGYYLITHYGG